MAKTFDNDEDLPNLPVPDLEETLALYLESVKPLVASTEKTKSLCETFEGKHLYDALVQRSQDKMAQNSNCKKIKLC